MSHPLVRPAVLLEALTGAAVSTSSDKNDGIFRCVRLHIENKSLIAESTDRYCWTRATFGADEVHSLDVLLDIADVKRAIQWIKALSKAYGVQPVALIVDGNALALQQFDEIATFDIVTPEIRFPKWDSIVPLEFPADFPANFVRFNPDLLAKLAKMPNNKRNAFVDIGFSTNHRAALARWKTDSIEWKYLVMPMRATAETTYYEW
jgi:DNA polymerase III sliding clamp (beta) subunit (PCNA family)